MKRIGIFTADLSTPGGSSRKGCLLAERLSRRYEVWLISRDRAEVRSLERSYGVSLANVHFHCVEMNEGLRASVWKRMTALVPGNARSIVEQFLPYQRLRELRLDLFIHNTSSHYMRAPAPHSIFMCMFPWPMSKFPSPSWCQLPLARPLIDYGLGHTLNRYLRTPETYDVITANSEFTAGWIKRLWNRDAAVVYSATELVPPPPPGNKEKIILAVGRYNGDKQLDVLIEAFRTMGELHTTGWELHFAGKVNRGNWSRRYHDRLVASAQGLPVVFHYDLSIEELRAFYQRSAINWLAKGYGIPADEPHRMEHFGNTPVEAMSAGCVPVVIDAGGPRETVQHGVNGFRWKRVEQLRDHTLRLARDPELLGTIRTRAMRVDPRFGVEPFLRAMEAIIEELLDV